MELHSVDIEHYKNLRNCHADFSNCGRLAVLAGVNGSGKSNFLEAVALVYHMFIRKTLEIAIVDGCRLLCSVAGSDYDIFSKSDGFEIKGVEHTFNFTGKGNLIVVYSGGFNRLIELGFAESVNEPVLFQNVFLISSKSYELLLLAKVLFDGRTGQSAKSKLLDLPRASKVRFSYKAVGVDLNDPPEDEFDYFFREILGRNGNAREYNEEISLDEFNQIMRAANQNWDTIDANTIYYVLTQLADGKYNNISNVQIIFECSDGSEFTSDALSEGEKWLAMYDTIYTSLADDNTLVLLDEPDAYIHETKKRDFIRFVEEHSKRGIFTMLTTHSPNIINAVRGQSLYGFSRNDDNAVTIKTFTDISFDDGLLDNRMSWFSNRPILLLEGISDVKLISGALDFYADHFDEYKEIKSKIDFELVTVGSADNMVEAYRVYRTAFMGRRIFVALDHDGKGNEVKVKLQKNFNLLDISQNLSSSCQDNALFLIPRPVHFPMTESNWVMEDYLPPEYIKEKVKEQVDNVKWFGTVVNLQKVIKAEIANRYVNFTEREWRGFKPLIDFLIKLAG